MNKTQKSWQKIKKESQQIIIRHTFWWLKTTRLKVLMQRNNSNVIGSRERHRERAIGGDFGSRGEANSWRENCQKHSNNKLNDSPDYHFA